MKNLFLILLCYSINLNLFASDAIDYYKLALSQYRANNYSASVSNLELAIKADEFNWKAHQLLGYCYFRLKDEWGSRAECQTSLRYHADNPRLEFFMAWLKTLEPRVVRKNDNGAYLEGRAEAQMPSPPDEYPNPIAFFSEDLSTATQASKKEGDYFWRAGGGLSLLFNNYLSSRNGFNGSFAAGIDQSDGFSFFTSAELNLFPESYYLYGYPYFTSYTWDKIFDLSLLENIQFRFSPLDGWCFYLLGGMGLDFICTQDYLFENYLSFQFGIGSEVVLRKGLSVYAEGKFHTALAYNQDIPVQYIFFPFQAGLKFLLGKPETAKPNSRPTLDSSEVNIGSYFDGNRLFTKFFFGVGVPLSNDITTDVDSFYNQYNGAIYESYKNLTEYQFGLEAGYSLDLHNGISVNYISRRSALFRLDNFASFSTGPAINQDFDLVLTQIGLNYYRYFPEASGRWYAIGGVVYSTASSNYSYYYHTAVGPITKETYSTSPLVGSGFAAFLGAGREWIVFENLGFDLSVRARAGSIPSLEGNYSMDTNGITQASGRGALIVYPDKTIGLLDLNDIAANQVRKMNVDLTGADAVLSLNVYF